jgi:hypothetical protein
LWYESRYYSNWLIFQIGIWRFNMATSKTSKPREIRPKPRNARALSKTIKTKAGRKRLAKALDQSGFGKFVKKQDARRRSATYTMRLDYDTSMKMEALALLLNVPRSRCMRYTIDYTYEKSRIALREMGLEWDRDYTRDNPDLLMAATRLIPLADAQMILAERAREIETAHASGKAPAQRKDDPMAHLGEDNSDAFDWMEPEIPANLKAFISWDESEESEDESGEQEEQEEQEESDEDDEDYEDEDYEDDEDDEDEEDDDDDEDDEFCEDDEGDEDEEDDEDDEDDEDGKENLVYEPPPEEAPAKPQPRSRTRTRTPEGV